MNASRFAIVLVTAPDMTAARMVAQAALKERCAACANLVSRIESHYWWQGKLEKSAEVLIIFKTVEKQLDRLEQCVLEHHPYDTPEFVVLRLRRGNRRYLDWIDESLRAE